jgi:integrase
MNNGKDKAGTEWLNSLKKSTRGSYKTYWKYFLEFTGMTGDQILVDRKADTEHKWSQLVLQFKQWLMDEKHLAPYTATTAAMAARGFFAYNYQPLIYRRTESKRLSEYTRKTEDYKFSVEDLKRMADVANLSEKYVLIAGKSFGLRAGDFLRLTRGDLEAYINRPVPISIGKIGTGKEKVPAYPFIDSDAQPVIKLMIEQMNRKGSVKPTDRVLTYKWEKELSQTLKRLTERAGLNVGNKRVRFHCLRKFLIDNISSLMSESKWKQIVGKKITEGAYVSPDSLREDYERAMSKTTFTKVVSENEVELRAAQRMLEMTLNLSPNIPDHIKQTLRKKIRAVKKMKDLKPVENEVTEQAKTSQQPNTETDSGCVDGAHCQRIVNEAELSALLPQGWRVAAVLPSGKIVVGNE